MYLDRAQFTQLLRFAPLVSIDLLVRSADGSLLLGWRINRPARKSWFVPGGRVQKDERLDDAFVRISQAEIGRPLQRSDARFRGVFEHFYPDGALDDANTTCSTHYVVLAYEIFTTDLNLTGLPAAQHKQFRWCDPAAASVDDGVHPYTKNYLSLLS